jgi:hypothetical protein
MHASWVASSTSLPPEGQVVEFLLDDRCVPMDGTYAHTSFHSRWTDYDVGRVRTWRPSSSSVLPPDLATP